VFLNLVLPGGVAGDVHRGVSHGRDVGDVGRGLRAVVWERGAGQVVQVVLTISVLLILPSPVHSAMPFVAVAVVVLGVVLLGLMKVGSGGSRWALLRNAVMADVRNGVLRRSALPAVLLTSVLVTLSHAATFLVATRSVGVNASFSRLLPLSLLAVLAMVLPSIAGWGPREGATAWIFAAAGLGVDRGAATAVAYGVLVFAACLPGALVLVAGSIPRRHVARARSHAGVVFRPEEAADA
jgi:glycosyltransferase 2 family protein